MSAPAQTKVFGIRIGVDPKILAGILIALAIILIWYNTRPDDDAGPAPVVRHDAVAPVAPVRPNIVARSRRVQNAGDRGTLRLRPIDASRGDVDPTLRLDLMGRLQNVQPAAPGRSLFDLGPPPLTMAEQNLLKHPPVIPKPAPAPPIQNSAALAAAQAVNIPLKYYGFVNSGVKNQGAEGLFLDGDNVIVGSEGELVMKRYLVVSLSPANARLEDTQLKKGQTLPVVPAAKP